MAEGDTITVELLGGLRVERDGATLAPDGWPTRRARELVALLALSEGRRLPREQVIERLWPHLGAQAGAANLRKSAHHARQALGDAGAIVLRAGTVALFDGHVVQTDVDRFLRAAEEALAQGDPAACAQAAALCQGELLPDAPYEAWTQDARRRVLTRLADLLRRGERWERLVELEPTEEDAYAALMRSELAAGRRHAALRWYERLRVALARELGTRPGSAVQALYEQCTAGVVEADPAVLGRDGELHAGMAVLAQARAGRPGAVFVEGPTGIGKSAVCRELAARAADGGWLILRGTCTADGPPYGPIAALVEQLIASTGGLLDTLPDRTRSVLAQLTPIAGPAPAPTGTLTRHQVIASLRRLLGGEPTVILAEDADRCDEATADVLHQLIAGSAGPLVLIAASRTDRPRARPAGGLTELQRDACSRTVTLAPLSYADTVALIEAAAAGPLLPATLGERARAAGGNPFFALELARAPEAHTALPVTVREAVMRRFADVGDGTIEALSRLAVGGDLVDLAAVEALTGLPEPDAFALLDEALESGLLVVDDGRYRFAHDLVRQALTDSVAPHRQLVLHREAAQRLTEAAGPPELIARHWIEGDRPLEAVPWLLAAARRATRLGGFADALGHVDALLGAAPEAVDALGLRAEILDALGDTRAPDAYGAAAAAAGDPEAQELRARQALAQLKASNPSAALRTLEGVQPKTLVGLLAQALTLSACAAIGAYGDGETAAAKADEAHRLAVELGDPGAILDATWAHALAAHAKGELPARLREYLRMTHELPELATRVFDGQLCVTERMLYGGLPSEEIITFADGLAAEAQRLGAVRGHAFARTLRGEVLVLAGRLEEADGAFADGARLHGQIGAIAGEALSLLGRAQVAVYEGRRAEARKLLADALLMARESEVGHHTLDRIYGAMVEAAESPDAALTVVRAAETAIRGPAETCPTCRIAFIVPAAIAAARAGDSDRARRYGQACDTAVEIVSLPPAWSAAVEEVHGWIAHADGDGAQARAHFRAAADGFAAWDIPLDAERCLALAAA